MRVRRERVLGGDTDGRPCARAILCSPGNAGVRWEPARALPASPSPSLSPGPLVGFLGWAGGVPVSVLPVPQRPRASIHEPTNRACQPADRRRSERGSGCCGVQEARTQRRTDFCGGGAWRESVRRGPRRHWHDERVRRDWAGPRGVPPLGSARTGAPREGWEKARHTLGRAPAWPRLSLVSISGRAFVMGG